LQTSGERRLRSVIFRGRRAPAARPTMKRPSTFRPRSASFGQNPCALADFVRGLQVGLLLSCSCGFRAWLAVFALRALSRRSARVACALAGMSLASLSKPPGDPSKPATSSNRGVSAENKDELSQTSSISVGGIDPELRSALLGLPAKIDALSARVSKTELAVALFTSPAMTSQLPPPVQQIDAKQTPLAQLRL